MRRNHFIATGLFLMVILGCVDLSVPPPKPHPSDKDLIDYFQKQQADFNTLVRMANEDSTVKAVLADSVMLGNKKLWPKQTEEGFTKQRWEEYQSLFARFKEYRIQSFTRYSNIIHISASVRISDLNDNDSIVLTKGYAYSLQEPPSSVESLDGLGFDSKGTFYKKIAEPWYLYHEWYFWQVK